LVGGKSPLLPREEEDAAFRDIVDWMMDTSTTTSTKETS
jgi:hypothetical protein